MLLQFVIEADNKHYYDTLFNLKSVDELPSVFTPTALLFDRDGSVVMLFDSTVDSENGVRVQINPEEQVGVQDIFL